jgi:hypothetical protein
MKLVCTNSFLKMLFIYIVRTLYPFVHTGYIHCTYQTQLKYILCTCQYRIMNFVHTLYVLLNFDFDQYVQTCTDNWKYDQVHTLFIIRHGPTWYVLCTYEYERVHPGCQSSRCTSLTWILHGVYMVQAFSIHAHYMLPWACNGHSWHVMDVMHQDSMLFKDSMLL